MNWSTRIRRAHRWLAIVFAASVVVTIVALALSGPVWFSYLPLPFLALLLFSGLYLLVRSYAKQVTASASPLRRTHRWSGVVFTLTVVATFIALALPDPLIWVSYLPLFPLALLLGTGLYMFFRSKPARSTARIGTWTVSSQRP